MKGAWLPIQTYPVVADNGDCEIRRGRFWLEVHDGYVDIFKTRAAECDEGFSVRLRDLLAAIARAEP